MMLGPLEVSYTNTNDEIDMPMRAKSQMPDKNVGGRMHVPIAGMFLEDMLALQQAAGLQAKLARLAPQRVLEHTLCKQRLLSGLHAS